MTQQEKNPRVEWGFYAVVPRIVRTGYKEIGPSEKWLYTCLKDLCGDKGTCFRTLETLSKETGLSTGSLSTMIPALHKAGLIHAEKKARGYGGKRVWHISIVDIWQSNKEYCSKSEDCPARSSSKSEVSPRVLQNLNDNLQNLNDAPEYSSKSERSSSNFADRRRTHEEQRNEERTIEEEGKGDAAIADHPPTPPAQSLQWDDFSAFDEGIPSEAENDTSSQLSTPSVDNSEKGHDDATADLADSLALHLDLAAAHAGPGESSEPESVATQADTLSQETAADSLPPPAPVAAPHSDVVPPAALPVQPTSEEPPVRGGRKRKPSAPREPKPERPPKPAKPVDIPLEATLSEDEMALYREWCSLFHVPVKLTASIAKAAKFLAAPLTIWAGLLGVERREVLKGYRGWEFSCNNRNGFFSRKGVQLYDLERDFEAWQSAMQQQLDEAARGKESPPEKVIAFGRDKPTRHISSFDDPEYDMSDEFYPAHPEPVAVQG